MIFTLFLRESLPPQWHDFSPENIRVAKQEAEASNRLRGMISSTLSQTSADMREQADRVEEALNRRLSETEEATRALEDELKAVRIFRACVVNSFCYVFKAASLFLASTFVFPVHSTPVQSYQILSDLANFVLSCQILSNFVKECQSVLSSLRSLIWTVFTSKLISENK